MLKNRILFGTDFPLITPERWMKDFEVAGFKEQLERKRYKNAGFEIELSNICK
jgi:predicted TIM-barrel fold metal-dependent hydrolase